MKLRLWTIQRAGAWETLQRHGVLRADPDWEPEDFKAAYDWMADKLARRVEQPPQGVRYPLWAWERWEGGSGCRDPRDPALGPEGADMVRLEFEIDRERVLLSDFDRWHTVLGGGYLALDEEEWERPSVSLEASWERIFDLDRWTPGWDTPPDEQSVQAVFWELRLDMVRQVTYFRAK